VRGRQLHALACMCARSCFCNFVSACPAFVAALLVWRFCGRPGKRVHRAWVPLLAAAPQGWGKGSGHLAGPRSTKLPLKALWAPSRHRHLALVWPSSLLALTLPPASSGCRRSCGPCAPRLGTRPRFGTGVPSPGWTRDAPAGPRAAPVQVGHKGCT